MEKSLKGQIATSIEDTLKSLFTKFKENISFDMSYKMDKPLMYNIWMIVDKKLSREKVLIMFENLSKKNFIKKEDIEKTVNEVMTSYKFRIAILPKSSTDFFINDLKEALGSSDAEFVLNEFSVSE